MDSRFIALVMVANEGKMEVATRKYFDRTTMIAAEYRKTKES